MKIAIIFRGDNVRENNHHSNRKYCDALLCWDNWQKAITEDLTKNGYNYDIIFITYDSPIIEKIKEIIKPKIIEIRERITQHHNFTDVGSFIKNNKDQYDRFMILRCDVEYRIPVTLWPKWQEKGIFIINKDVHWPTQKLYADIVFIVDSSEVDIFITASNTCTYCIHDLGKYLYENNIAFHLLYNEYYAMTNHPLHSLASSEETPDLNNPNPGIQILDISMYN